jgi:hypothetical protein
MLGGKVLYVIGKSYLENGVYKTAATSSSIICIAMRTDNFIQTHHGLGTTYFVRISGSLSYFIGGDSLYPEDHGFALHPWRSVRWENTGIRIYDNIAIAMGNYYFSPAEGGSEVKVEYSFVYLKDTNGTIKITLHDSHFPLHSERKA